ncbi:MAG: Sua5/YciO/YrdC/YwlC family protein, partial [Rhodospirillales bacterium]
MAPPPVLLRPDGPGLEQAAGALRAGELIAFPTETVYGLGADAADEKAVAR